MMFFSFLMQIGIYTSDVQQHTHSRWNFFLSSWWVHNDNRYILEYKK